MFSRNMCVSVLHLVVGIGSKYNIKFGTLVPLNFWDGFGQWTLIFLFGDCKMAVAILLELDLLRKE